MKKIAFWLILSIISMLTFAASASAHVTVWPKETTQGSYEKFTVRIPNEKDTATVKIEVKFPKEVEISRFEKKPGWTYKFQKDINGLITGAIWTSMDTGIEPNEFAEFNIQGKVGKEASQIIWKAYQTYKDGTVVEWTGAPDADKPASVTTVKPGKGDAQGRSDEHREEQPDPAVQPDGPIAERTLPAQSSAPLYLSFISLAVAAAALFFALRRRN